MLKSKIEVEESQAAPAITPDLLSKLKTQDMQAAVVERFSVRGKAQAPRAIRSLER
jgi:hypothetical protein